MKTTKELIIADITSKSTKQKDKHTKFNQCESFTIDGKIWSGETHKDNK
jgi:hypothetical protein